MIGINVSRPKGDQEELVYDLVQSTAEHVGVNFDIAREAVVCFDQYVGPGYSLPTPEMAEAVRMLARLEGVLIDPVYRITSYNVCYTKLLRAMKALKK